MIASLLATTLHVVYLYSALIGGGMVLITAAFYFFFSSSFPPDRQEDVEQEKFYQQQQILWDLDPARIFMYFLTFNYSILSPILVGAAVFGLLGLGLSARNWDDKDSLFVAIFLGAISTFLVGWLVWVKKSPPADGTFRGGNGES